MKTLFFLILGSIFCMVSFSQENANLFYAQDAIANLNDSRLNEISGIADCRSRSNFFWMHNDSGDSSRIFLISRSGAVERRIYFRETVLDCEDIAVGIGAKKGNFVYLGDIGDNYLFRSNVTVYIFREDSLLMGSSAYTTITKYRKTILQYPDGPHDAESLVVDPVDSALYLITKNDAKAGIYGVSLKKLFKGASVILKK